MAAYERAFALWPQPSEEFDLETATATTRVHACRPHRDGTPVVLLSGAGFNASMWYPHVKALANNHPVYGVDMPGDPNPSIPRALMTPPQSCAAWLDELLASSATARRTWSAPPTAAGSPLTRRSARLRGSPPSPCSTRPG